jgi:hexosaminidase
MLKRFIAATFLFFILFVFTEAGAQLSASIIPKPVAVLEGKGPAVSLNERSVITYDPFFAPQAAYLREQLAIQTGIIFQTKEGSKSGNNGTIRLAYDHKKINRNEMYTLDAAGSMVTITAKDVEGLVHGIQTLLQLIPLKKVKEISVEPVTISDYPRFSYRGMHLDVSRHIFPVDFIKKYIDYLAFHKLNTFHWHLTDDQGWRIEIKSYPKLTSIGAWRKETLIGHFNNAPPRYDGKPYGGFYTQEEVKDVIRYAQIRGITIIPEIDIPGHSRAAIAAYPELSTRPDSAWQVATTWGMYNRQNNVLAPTAATIRFLETVFSELADLFPSEYIHIGGDETSKRWWKESPETQKFIRDNNLKDETGLQTWFVNKVASILTAKGKKIIGWHEIIEGKPDPASIIMNWADEKKALEIVNRKYQVIMSPGKPLYFDHYPTQRKDSLAIHGFNPMEAVYLYNPVAKIPSSLQKLVLGAQANLWTEYIEYPSKVEYMVFPRMTALSEALWTPLSKKDLKDFNLRLKNYMIPRYKNWGSSYVGEEAIGF